ncbi:hypothetical protein BE11_33335 [Sorangium cellulosum]|nr:hypothetical protein BE11_33335 [Sorangium cellulosum]
MSSRHRRSGRDRGGAPPLTCRTGEPLRAPRSPLLLDEQREPERDVLATSERLGLAAAGRGATTP